MAKFTNHDLILDADRVDFEVLFPNLEGRKERYNDDGDRTFRLKFNDPEFAQQLSEDGWNIRIYTPKNEDYDPYHYLTVKTKFRVDSEKVRQDPEIHLVNSKNDILCGPQNMHDVDMAFLNHKAERVDLVIAPRYWANAGIGKGEGITAYIREMWVEIQDSPFASRYANRSNFNAGSEEVPF